MSWPGDFKLLCNTNVLVTCSPNFCQRTSNVCPVDRTYVAQRHFAAFSDTLGIAFCCLWQYVQLYIPPFLFSLPPTSCLANSIEEVSNVSSGILFLPYGAICGAIPEHLILISSRSYSWCWQKYLNAHRQSLSDRQNSNLKLLVIVLKY